MRSLRHPHGEEIDGPAPEWLEHIFGHVGSVDAAVLVAVQGVDAMLPDVHHGCCLPQLATKREPEFERTFNRMLRVPSAKELWLRRD